MGRATDECDPDAEYAGDHFLGSAVDVATFLLVLVTFVYQVNPTQDTLSAAVVALAEEHPTVDDDRLRSELEVEERDINAVRPTIADGDGDASD